jgi:polyferredoxin
MTISKHSRQRTRWIRRLIQAGFAAFILISAVRHNTSAAHLPSTDAFGAVATLWTFATTGTFVQKTHPSNLVLGVGLLLGALVAGASFCGWICPFGAFFDALSWIRRRLRLPELNVPRRIDRVLTFGRYLTLIAIPLATILTARLWFSDYDPYRTIFGLGWLFEFNLAEHWPAYTIAIAITAGGFFIPRFWCRYLCPQGVLLGLIQRVSPVHIRRDPVTCISCRRCDHVCPSKLSVSTAGAVRGDCIGCLECVEVCPVPDTLEVYVGRPAARVKQEAVQ